MKIDVKFFQGLLHMLETNHNIVRKDDNISESWKFIVDNTIVQCKELVNMGRKAGLPKEKIVKHFAPPLILEDENYGLMPSVLASKKNILKAIKKGTRFMMETDYIDDPRRPGAVLGPKTVPKRTQELLEMELITQEEMSIIHKENPEKTYGINLE